MPIVRDFSHWNIISDYPAVAASADAFIIKNYDAEIPGGTGEDPAHDEHFAGLSAKPVAEYLYLDPRGNPRNQVLGYMKHSYRGFLDALDLEETEGLIHQAVTNVTIETLENGIIESGRKWWLYSNLNFLDYILTEPQKIAELIAGIWLSWPVHSAPNPRMPEHYPPELVKLWQRSWKAEVDGVEGHSDESLWLGTQEEFDALVGQSPDEPAEPVQIAVSGPEGSFELSVEEF